MKKLLPLLAILSIVACSKKDLNPLNHEVTWRFVFYDSNNRVVDSSPELRYPDSAEVTMMGPDPVSTIPPLAPFDTTVWPEPGRFYLVVGPRLLAPGEYNLQVPAGG